MEIILDTANLEEIKEAVEYLPISGLTCNPSIVKKTANTTDLYGHLRAIRKILGKKRTLHVQVVAQDSETQIKEAHHLVKMVDKDVYIKVPTTYEGIKTIRKLKEEGFNVTATSVYDTMQAYLALAAGADYITVYTDRMTSFGTDPNELYMNMANRIDHDGYKTKILGAGFHSTGQIREALNSGCETITAPLDLLKKCFTNENLIHAIDTFSNDWEDVFGKGANLIKQEKKATKKKAKK